MWPSSRRKPDAVWRIITILVISAVGSWLSRVERPIDRSTPARERSIFVSNIVSEDGRERSVWQDQESYSAGDSNKFDYYDTQQFNHFYNILLMLRIVKDANPMILWNYCQHPEFFTNWVASKFTDCFDNITRYWKGTINRVSAPQARFSPKYCLLIVDLRLGNLSFPTSQSVSNCKNQLKISKNPKFIIWYKIWFDTKISALEQIVRLQREPTDQLHMT